MSTTLNQNTNWKEYNKARKEERKKRNEEKLIKKMKKLENEIKDNEPNLEPLEPVSTLAIAVPGSILDNAQSQELRTYLAGQIARAACIFQIDEVIVFDDCPDAIGDKKAQIEMEDGTKTSKRCCVQLARILQYLECPQYLRKHFFPIHNDLQYAGILNPLDAPHHLRQQNDFIFRYFMLIAHTLNILILILLFIIGKALLRISQQNLVKAPLLTLAFYMMFV